jgi:hypothetical protein
MKTLKRQSGMSMFGVLIIMGLTSFFLLVTIRLLPTYMDGRGLKTVLEGVVAGSTPGESLQDINRRIVSTFITNQIDVMDPRKVKVYRDKGKILIEANYEKRTNLFKGVDAVLMFTDLTFVIE